jgi:prepilin-type N-terminal cleavage/methylation domain-containing protein
MTSPKPSRLARLGSHDGFTLLETLCALGLLAILAAGVLPLGVLATKVTENQGHLVARTTEYAQDKLEQLLALAYGDSTSDTRVFPATTTGGTGLTIGGSVVTTAPVAGYVDYLDANGNVLAAAGTTPPAGWFYMRAWQVSSPRANLKQVTVTAIVRVSAVGGTGSIPRSSVAALKTSPF